jgi:hypothetical protein
MGERRGLVRELVLVVGISLLAAFLRLYQIDSLPPGDGYDPAVYGLDALDILGGARPIYLPTNFGREALFSYLVACCVAVLGIGPQAIYTASAIVGVLTVPAVYFMAREFLASERGILARWGGLLAALATAVSYWHLSWSRLGVRAILVPLLMSVTMGLLWRGQRTGERWAFLGCGVSLGLSMYTYQAARLLPVLVLLGFVYAAWSRRSFSRRDLSNLAQVALTAGMIFAPLGVYFVAHPGVSTARIEQTLAVDPSQGLGGVARTLRDQLVETVSALLVRGDDWPKVNPPGRPALNPFLSLAFLLGLVVSLVRIGRSNTLSLLTWLALLLAPALLAGRGPMTKRAIGMLPAVMILIAIGCLVSWQAAQRWAARWDLRWAKGLSVGLAICIGAGFAYSAVRTYLDYFERWGSDPNLFTYFEAGLSATGRYIRMRPSEERIYLSSVSPEHPSVLYNSWRRSNVKGYNGRACLVLADGAVHDVSYVIAPAEDKNGLPKLQAALPQGWVADEGPLHYGRPYFLAYRVPAGARAQVAPGHVREVDWAKGDGDVRLRLLGYDLDKTAFAPGDTAYLTLYCRATGQVEGDYTVFVHLLGPHNPATGGPLWAQDDSEPCRRSYRTSAWGPNEIVVDRYAMTIPPDAPAGEYEIEVGFYRWDTLVRLPVLDAAGQIAADHVILTSVNVGGAN